MAVRQSVDRVLEEGPWILGEAVASFESAFASYTGTEHVVGVGNGSDALVLAFIALDLPRDSAVLVSANEGGYAASAAQQAGLRVRVMDVDPTTGAPGVAHAVAADASDVSALVVTHLHGDPVPLSGPRGLDEWRRRRGLALVEDCAQAHGLPVGGRGDAATWSFYPTKNLGAVGDGGAIAFARRSEAERARSLRQYGWGERYRIDVARGRNTRLDALQAAVLAARLPFLSARNERRRSIAARYAHALAGSSTRLLNEVSTTVAHHAVVVTEQRDALDRRFADAAVATAVHYPYLLGEMPGLPTAPHQDSGARWLRDRILTIPCFPEMTEDEIARVSDVLADWAARDA